MSSSARWIIVGSVRCPVAPMPLDWNNPSMAEAGSPDIVRFTHCGVVFMGASQACGDVRYGSSAVRIPRQSGSDQSCTQRQCDRLRSAFDSKFGEDMRQVGGDG